ncbi:MAG: hypothetical protein JXA93_02045 [Anaerolineae bacterium]|nr:hypothetical protein [Anaerolineae bacterium]
MASQTGMNTQAIPQAIAEQLCREIREENRGKWWRWTAWWCWGCERFSKGPENLCFANHPELRGCAQVNARYDRSQ